MSMASEGIVIAGHRGGMCIGEYVEFIKYEKTYYTLSSTFSPLSRLPLRYEYFIDSNVASPPSPPPPRAAQFLFRYLLRSR